MGRVGAALIVLLLTASAARADAWSAKLAGEFVANFRDLCLTDRPFETVAAELEKQGRIRGLRDDGRLLATLSVLTREVLGGSGTSQLPVYTIGVYPRAISAGQTQSCAAAILHEDYASQIAPFVTKLTELQPLPFPAIVRIRKSCVRDCLARPHSRDCADPSARFRRSGCPRGGRCRRNR